MIPAGKASVVIDDKVRLTCTNAIFANGSWWSTVKIVGTVWAQ
jgi:hypothetical protein